MNRSREPQFAPVVQAMCPPMELFPCGLLTFLIEPLTSLREGTRDASDRFQRGDLCGALAWHCR